MHLFFRHNCTRHHQVHLAETVQTIYITEAKKKKTPNNNTANPTTTSLYNSTKLKRAPQTTLFNLKKLIQLTQIYNTFNRNITLSSQRDLLQD